MILGVRFLFINFSILWKKVDGNIIDLPVILTPLNEPWFPYRWGTPDEQVAATDPAATLTPDLTPIRLSPWQIFCYNKKG